MFMLAVQPFNVTMVTSMFMPRDRPIIKASMFTPRAQVALVFMPRAKAACYGESSEKGDGSKEGRYV